MRFELTTTGTAGVHRLLDLAKGEADIAIRRVAPSDGSLFGRKIAGSHWAVYATRSYVKRYGRIERFEDIDSHRVIIAPLPLAVGESESDLERLLDPIPGVATEFYLLMHEDMRRTPRVRAFFDFIVDELKFVGSVLGDT